MTAYGTQGAVLRPQRVVIALTLAAGAAFVVMLLFAFAVVTGAKLGGGGSVAAAESALPAEVSQLARAEIPHRYLQLYIAAAERYGLDWAILAGIGRVECDHGRDPSPSCTQEGAENSAGAGGPMQFLASTWARYGVNPYGDAPPDRWRPADAIFSAANYLHTAGAPSDYREAIYAYNHATWYVEEVDEWAKRYTGKPGEADGGQASTPASLDGEQGGTSVSLDALAARGGLAGTPDRAFSQSVSGTPVLYVPGEQAKLLRGDGHVALVPEDAPPTVQAMVIAGNELQDLPYGPTGHPDPLGASSEDCSSTVNYVLYRAGVRSLQEILSQNPLAQDYVHWGDPGPGRWVTIYATDAPTPHVFIVIAGLRLDTSHDGTDEGPNRDEDGPRWRLLSYIPTWAHWAVRHPPGL